MTDRFCTLESDPGVFSSLIHDFGVKDTAVEEIYSLEGSEQRKKQSYGLIFLFKWKAELEGSDTRTVLDPADCPVFFARQIVHNACATQAILSVLLNAEGIDLGETLTDFKAFTSEIDSESKGIAIGNSDVLREVHNSFARPEPFLHEEVKSSKDDGEDVYHFIAYVPCQGKVYELDGLKQGPILLGEVADAADGWWGVAKPVIEARMNRYSQSETHFALLSIGEKRLTVLESELASITNRLAAIEMAASTGHGRATKLADGFEVAGDDSSLLSQRENTLLELESLRGELADENQKLKKQAEENVRRKHNYVPLAIALMRHLAAKGKLHAMVDSAKTRRSNTATSTTGKH